MTAFKWLAYFALAGTIAPSFQAKPLPGKRHRSTLPSKKPGSQIIAPVTVNHTGPYNFLVDTGSQLTIIDSSLAAALHLDGHGWQRSLSASASMRDILRANGFSGAGLALRARPAGDCSGSRA